MKTANLLVTILLAGLLFPHATSSQESAAKPKPCAAPAYRQFDFWMGSWEVSAGSKKAGNNVIAAINSGCALREEWTGAGGSRGTSLNFYSSADDKWHQVWVDNNGTILNLEGGFADGKMVLSGASERGGKSVVDRITWHDQTDGTVRQVWDVSNDGGATWRTIFDGLYTRKPEGSRSE